MKELLDYLKHLNMKGLFIEPSDNGLIQFFRYAFVGGIATIVDWGTLYIVTRLGVYYMISTVIAFVAGLTVNYILSKKFVFNKSEAKVGPVVEFLAYAAIGAVGLVITMGIMYGLTELVGIHYMLSKVFATLVVLAWNYIIRKITLYK